MRKKGNAQPLQALTPLEPQSRAGETPLKFQAICPHNGAAVLKRLRTALSIWSQKRLGIGVRFTLLGLPFRAGDNWGQITWSLSGLSRKRDWSSNGVKVCVHRGFQKGLKTRPAGVS